MFICGQMPFLTTSNSVNIRQFTTHKTNELPKH